MDTIRTYAPDSEAVLKLKLACYELMNRNEHGTKFSVQDTYFDFGQRWMWTTIIAKRKNGDTWQILSPRQHEDILNSDDISQTVDDIMNDKFWYDPA